MSTANHSDDYIVTLLKEIAEGDRETIMAKLRAAALAHPRDPRALSLLAGEFASTSRYDEAEAAFIGALQRDPGYVLARFQLGLLRYMQGRVTSAAATWDPLAALPPAHEYRLFANGLEMLAQDRLGEAAAALEAGMAANRSNGPLNQDMLRVLGRVNARRAEQDAAAAAEMANSDADHFLVSSYRKTSLDADTGQS